MSRKNTAYSLHLYHHSVVPQPPTTEVPSSHSRKLCPNPLCEPSGSSTDPSQPHLSITTSAEKA
ncbi:hypothetical protein BDV95DRAFT_578951 [Massariosphaeria phaeospora]|uniref:Uncharacterized protein n=1 Tax=Massariosphaeria phaeospora TaxID=100035 RepID=A0A7C8I1V9_9PLEO|nr:hypothetical protein BDV95DRAFT_578951 [Massariosphaeria phaeospora]